MTQLDELLDTEREGWEALACGRGAEHYRANLAADAQREGQEVYRAVVSRTFVRVEGQWRLAFHQQTPVARD